MAAHYAECEMIKKDREVGCPLPTGGAVLGGGCVPPQRIFFEFSSKKCRVLLWVEILAGGSTPPTSLPVNSHVL